MVRSRRRVLGAGLFGVLAVALATVPLWGSDYAVLFSLLFCAYLGLAEMWNLLAGYSGLVSLGQQAFVGVGGYTVGVLVNHFGANVWVAVLCAGLTSVVLALLMSLFIFRMKGVYFSIGTWVFAEALMIWVTNWAYVGYGMGIFLKPVPQPSMTAMYYAAFLSALGSVLLVYGVLRSRLGLGLMAMRDDEEASAAAGVEIFRTKLFCFLLSAFGTGIAAGTFYVYQIYVEPHQAFSINWTVVLVFICIIGGMGTVEGPIVGTFLYVLLSQTLAEYASVSMILLGAVAIGVILAAPRGIMGSLQERTGFEVLSPRRT